MDIQLYQNGLKIGTGGVNVFINPESDVDNGVIILPSPNASFDTTDERLIIEGPGEYEFQGIYIKGIRKNGFISYTIKANEREVYFTTSEGLASVPEDEPFDTVVVEVTEAIDDSQVSNMSYPLVFIDRKELLPSSLEAQRVKSINLKKLSPEERNIFILK